MKLILLSWFLNRVFPDFIFILERHGIFFLIKHFLPENFITAHIFLAFELILISEFCYWLIGVFAEFYTLINPFNRDPK